MSDRGAQVSPVARLRKRVEAAQQYRRRWDVLLKDLYDYVIPYRNDFASATPGAALTDKIFDGTAMESAFRFAGRMQSDLVPPGQNFFKLHLGPAAPTNVADKKKYDEELEQATATISAAINASSFHLAAHEMFLDLFAGTGAMLILEGDDREPIRFVAPPAREVTLEAGPYGGVWSIHWVKAFPAEQLPVMWPKGKFSEALRQKIKDTPEAMIGICQSTVWQPEKKIWELCVFEHAVTEGKTPAQRTGSDDVEIFCEEYATCPWLTPRFMIVPGEPYGRGPGMIALPFVKTLNKAVELDLKAAALALYGIWASRDDDFNTETARFEPGAIWNVASTGGPLGPSLVKLDVPGKYDLSRMIVDEQRMQIRRAMFDDTLPPDTGAVRSATEIMERMKRLSEDLGGVFGRLTLEIIRPLVERVMEILAKKKILPAAITIDQLRVAIKVVSPIADTQSAAAARKIVDYAQMISMLQGPQAVPRYVRDEAFVDLGRGIGVAEKHITSEAERAEFDKGAAQAANADNTAALQKEIIKGAVAGGIRPDGMMQ